MNRTPEKELLASGHNACAGCGAMILLRHLLRIFGKETMMSLPACCTSLLAGIHPYTSVRIPLLHCAFETAGATATGVKAGRDLLGKKDTTVFAWVGDGGTFDIGLQALSGAAERNENFIYVCYDNEAYMNTGIQRSSATPYGAWTTTTPKSKEEPKKNIVEIMAAHRIPYIATATVAFLEDFERKLLIAKETKGMRFLHLLAPCVSGWKIESSKTIAISRLAVETNIFPLYEVKNGLIWTVSHKPKIAKPVQEYLNKQGRFAHLTEKDFEIIQKNVNFEWNLLLKKEAASA